MTTVDALRATQGTARSFRTRQVADPAGFVRTYGAFVVAGDRPLSVDHWFAAVERARIDVPADCARGKLAIVEHVGGRWSVRAHQLADDGTDGDIVACSNATAAAAAVVAETTEAEEAVLALELTDGKDATVTAIVDRNTSPAHRVIQRWTGVRCAFEAETLVDGRACIRVSGSLNHYLVVRTRDTADLDTISLDDAVRLSHHFGHDEEPLTSRIAFVDVRGDRRRARFFTCDQRQHPSAPLTGLAVLALAAGAVDWLTPAASIDVPVGTMHLPAVNWASAGTAAIEFPPILVDLEPPAR